MERREGMADESTRAFSDPSHAGHLARHVCLGLDLWSVEFEGRASLVLFRRVSPTRVRRIASSLGTDKATGRRLETPTLAVGAVHAGGNLAGS